MIVQKIEEFNDLYLAEVKKVNIKKIYWTLPLNVYNGLKLGHLKETQLDQTFRLLI